MVGNETNISDDVVRRVLFIYVVVYETMYEGVYAYLHFNCYTVP